MFIAITCDLFASSRIFIDGYVRRCIVIASCVLLCVGTSRAQDAFVVGEIRIEGLQRISEGTVYNYLPINIGDPLDARRIGEAIRALFATGFFQDVELRRDGGTLIVVVLERPSIERFEIKGNKDIKTDDLQRSLRNVGLAAGKTFDRSVLDEVKQYLAEQYHSRGKYGVRIDAAVDELPGNKVAIVIDIKEGARSRVRGINVVGNTTFSDEELLADFELGTSNWLSWYRQDDRYAREVLSGDLEKLRSYYMDRGYANFQVTSTQVSLSPETNDLFVTINVDEGPVFKVSDVKFAGDLILPKSELERFVTIAPGSTYSQRLITETTEAIKFRLELAGYAFAKVDPVHQPVDEPNALAITLVVDPGHRIYVRRINFTGTTAINDDVLRREMRQLEGAVLSNSAVERSKQRIQRLPYVESVELETTPVPGTPDLVDIDLTVKDGMPGQFGGGIGYSESQSLIATLNAVHTNFLGTGERLALDASGGSYSKYYRLSHTDPYVTVDGISRTLNFSYADVKQLTSSYSKFSTETYLAGIELSYPLTEHQYLAYGVSFSHAELVTSLYSSTQLQDWVRHNGDPFFRLEGGSHVLGTEANIIEFSSGWSFDSRDRLLFPTRGSAHRFNVNVTAPGSPIEYLTANYQYQQYLELPLPPLIPSLDSLRFSFDGRIGYATALGNTTAVPPNRQFLIGGPDSVRGFKESSLGPRDSLGNPYGGDAAISGQFEAILPMPKKFDKSARVSLFVDFGQAFHVGDTKFRNRSGGRADYGFDLSDLRASTGISVEWLAPLGLFRFSYAFPLRYEEATRRQFGDELERFQFSIGRAF